MKNCIAIVLGAGVVLGLVGGLGGLAGCEEKRPETAPTTTPNTTTPDATTTPGKTTTPQPGAVIDSARDAGRQAVDTTRDAANKGADAVKSAATALTDEARTTATRYLDALGDLGDTLEKIKSPLDAAGKAGAVKSETTALSSTYATLQQYSADTQAAIRSTFQNQLESLTKKVNDQIARISADQTLSSSLGEALKGIKLF